jgi:predicted HAD superfamily Cof-like phosphohydrolase
VEEQTTTTKEIARNVNEAAVGESQVTETITSVALAAKDTSIGAQSTQTAARKLAQMATELQDLLGQFKYANGDSATDTSKRVALPGRQPTKQQLAKIGAAT